MFENQPKGLYALALANTGERFGYYTMIAVFALFLGENFGLSESVSGIIYGAFLGLVYFLPLVGGIMADKFGFGRMVTIGILIMFFGYLLLAVPLGSGGVALAGMFAALLLISFGTGLFKGNLQVMVGNLYDDPQYATQRDSGFSIFYMAINIGALFAPTAAVEIMKWAETSLGFSHADSYHFAFAVACVSLILSIAIYYAFRGTFRHVEGDKKKDAAAGAAVSEELSPEETRQRITALVLVFAVVIFFWMAFHQNGLSLTYFANQFTQKTAEGVHTMPFNVWNLVAIIFIVYGLFSLFQSKTTKGKAVAGVVVAVAGCFLGYQYGQATGSVEISAPIFQQFNPFYVVALTPVSMAIFGSLAAKGKEPKAPRKIAYGMIVAAVAFCVMIFASQGLLTPNEQKAAIEAGTATYPASPYWLISVYLILTFGELLLSPMGISFVSKVAPPKYKGMMMGGWFVATAIGNLLVSVGGILWGGLSLTVVWLVFASLCLLSALFMFSMMKRLEKVA
ncbi:MAG: peptide MFS transporter [Bacteroidaceae bacterium]|nr:peptide MFS transporter [Bacteroidaceae bacterium]